MDLPGFGYSDIPKGRYSPSNYAKIIHWLKQQYSQKKVVVIGHSMGAAVALRYASTYPDDIDTLVMVSTAGILERTSFIKSGAKIPIDVTLLPTSLQSVVAGLKDISDFFVETVMSGPDPIASIKENDTAWDIIFSNLPNANAGLAMLDENFSQAVYTTPHHTSLIWGREDTTAPLRTGKLLSQNMPNAILSIINGAPMYHADSPRGV